MKIIAEFCQNHNGDFSILKEMIHMASENGASHGKIQNIFSDDLTYRDRFENGLIENDQVIHIKRPYDAEYKRLKNLEINYNLQHDFISYCKEYNLVPMTTCFTVNRVIELSELDWQSIKVASYDCASLKMIKEISNYFNELFISTGATYDHEIENTANFLNSKKIDFSFLHCVTIYPTPLENLNLSRLEYLKKFTNNVGFSDHSLVKADNLIASKAAIFLDVSVIERHFTILKDDQTKDGPVSINPEQLSDIYSFSKLSKDDQKLYLNEFSSNWEQIVLGSKHRELSDLELLNRDYYRGRFSSKDSYGNIINNW